MNLPVGELIEEGLSAREMDFRKALGSLVKNSFTGYIVITADGSAGIEEGILIFKKGELVASVFEYNKFDVTVFGDAAIDHFFNSTQAEFAMVDISTLTTQQVDLITAFNEKIETFETVSPKTLNKLVPSKYNGELAKKVLAEALHKEESKHDIFRKLGLTDIRG